MLPNIKACQSETAKNTHKKYTGRLLGKGSLSILTSSCHVCLHSHKMLLWLYWLDGLEGLLNQLNG